MILGPSKPYSVSGFIASKTWKVSYKCIGMQRLYGKYVPIGPRQ
jgi:hypothetical protein